MAINTRPATIISRPGAIISHLGAIISRLTTIISTPGAITGKLMNIAIIRNHSFTPPAGNHDKLMFCPAHSTTKKRR